MVYALDFNNIASPLSSRDPLIGVFFRFCCLFVGSRFAPPPRYFLATRSPRVNAPHEKFYVKKFGAAQNHL
jgi:hypothetical protein